MFPQELIYHMNNQFDYFQIFVIICIQMMN